MLWKFWMIKGLWLEENKEILLFLIEIKNFFIYKFGFCSFLNYKILLILFRIKLKNIFSLELYYFIKI